MKPEEVYRCAYCDAVIDRSDVVWFNAWADQAYATAHVVDEEDDTPQDPEPHCSLGCAVLAAPGELAGDPRLHDILMAVHEVAGRSVFRVAQAATTEYVMSDDGIELPPPRQAWGDE